MNHRRIVRMPNRVVNWLYLTTGVPGRKPNYFRLANNPRRAAYTADDDEASRVGGLAPLTTSHSMNAISPKTAGCV
jgi:hypothetical protein